MCKCNRFYVGLELRYIHRNEKGRYEIIEDFLDDECTFVEIDYCPFCGKKLEYNKE